LKQVDNIEILVDVALLFKMYYENSLWNPQEEIVIQVENCCAMKNLLPNRQQKTVSHNAKSKGLVPPNTSHFCNQAGIHR
jgi:hypothetical protein